MNTHPSPGGYAATTLLLIAFTNALTFGWLDAGDGPLAAVGYGLLVSASIVMLVVAIFTVMHTYEVIRERRRLLEFNRDLTDAPDAPDDDLPTTYKIGEVTFYPVRLTAPVMRAVIEALAPPPEQQVNIGPTGFGMATGWTPELRLAHLEALYRQLSILLVDDRHEHPTEEFLGERLTVEEAQAIVNEILNTDDDE